jgi:hypothetical protein
VKRIRWFAATWPISLRTLATKMKSQVFTEDSDSGFIIDRTRENLISGRYVEKISFQEILTTPFGDEQVFDRILYRQLEFNLFTTFPNIELWDAPRSTQAYVSKLIELNNFEVTLAPLSVDPLKWLSGFQRLVNTNVTVDSLQISGLEVEPNITARISIAGGQDVREALQHMTKGRRFDLDKVQLKLVHEGEIVNIQLTNAAAAKLDESIVEDFLPALRQSVPMPQ